MNWKEHERKLLWLNFRCHHSICLDRLKKSMKTLKPSFEPETYQKRSRIANHSPKIVGNINVINICMVFLLSHVDFIENPSKDSKHTRNIQFMPVSHLKAKETYRL
jgi:hypothetical protein